MAERKGIDEKRLPFRQQKGFLGYSNEKKWETVNRLFKDSVDVHINMGQDYTGGLWSGREEGPVDRPFDDIEIALRASELGMKAIVFTCHVGPGFFRVPLIQKAVDDWAAACGKRPVKVVGSITLNYAMGGLNPEVVRMMVRFGGKVVLMPTNDGRHDRKVFGLKDGIEIVKRGKVVPALEEIIGIMADNSLVMDISHVDAEQRFILLDEGKKAGIKGFYVFNPVPVAGSMIGATAEQWVELAKRGLKLMPGGSARRDPKVLKWFIEKVGAESLVSGTDLNQWLNPHPVEGLRQFLVQCLTAGMFESDVVKMFKTNPAKLLDL